MFDFALIAAFARSATAERRTSYVDYRPSSAAIAKVTCATAFAWASFDRVGDKFNVGARALMPLSVQSFLVSLHTSSVTQHAYALQSTILSKWLH